ncbi:hypothetical protein GCM10011402_37280 [Paracoccus acridae]|uniref:Uncharacterized protein n=2 Tax=Paracoccus acridae TaxID=1795310 RepID=A0ABQ1VMQ7_9RHOB|nr:hypothetical protein GCM10011402_37280 [Paracoccus acridae]
MADQSCDYHMVVQDDALVASDFYARLEQYLKEDNAPDVLCLFYRMKSKNTHAEFNSAGLNSWKEGGFFFDRLQFAVCVVIRTELIGDMLRYGNDLSEEKYANVDDLRFSAFFKKRGIKTFYTLPSLVDHEGTIESTVREGGLGRIAAWFADGPNGLAAECERRSAKGD